MAIRMGPVAAFEALANPICVNSTSAIRQRKNFTRTCRPAVSASAVTGLTVAIVFTTIGLKQTPERLTTILEALRSNEYSQNELDSASILPYRRHHDIRRVPMCALRAFDRSASFRRLFGLRTGMHRGKAVAPEGRQPRAEGACLVVARTTSSSADEGKELVPYHQKSAAGGGLRVEVLNQSGQAGDTNANGLIAQRAKLGRPN